MSGEGFKFQASVKDADGDMVNVRADSAEELGAYLSNFPVAEYAQFKANVRGGAALGGITQPQAPPVQQEQPQWSQPQQQAAPQQQNQGWGAAQQQAPQQQQQQYGGGGGQSKFAGPPHPEGKTCDICPNVLEFKKTSTGKGTWRCSEWRWNNATPNGHSSEFA
jgi:hypothetical protein